MKQASAQQYDYERYEAILKSTLNGDGICHRAEAVKMFSKELATESDRVEEFAHARAEQVAKRFDEKRTPDTSEDGNLLLFNDTSWLVLGENDRVHANEASQNHLRRYLDVLAENHAATARAYGNKDKAVRKLIATMEEHGFPTAGEAQEFLLGLE